MNDLKPYKHAAKQKRVCRVYDETISQEPLPEGHTGSFAVPTVEGRCCAVTTRDHVTGRRRCMSVRSGWRPGNEFMASPVCRAHKRLESSARVWLASQDGAA